MGHRSRFWHSELAVLACLGLHKRAVALDADQPPTLSGRASNGTAIPKGAKPGIAG